MGTLTNEGWMIDFIIKLRAMSLRKYSFYFKFLEPVVPLLDKLYGN